MQSSASSHTWERGRRNRSGVAGLPGGRIVIETAVLTAVLAVLATVAWHVLSPEIYAEVTENGVRMSTAESGRLFGIEVWFASVTAAAGLIAGTYLMFRHQFEAVRVQVLLLVAGVVATVAVWLLGLLTGPGDPAARATAAEPGEMLKMPLDVESYALLAAWPIAALVAGAVVVALTDRPDDGGPDRRDVS